MGCLNCPVGHTLVIGWGQPTRSTDTRWWACPAGRHLPNILLQQQSWNVHGTFSWPRQPCPKQWGQRSEQERHDPCLEEHTVWWGQLKNHSNKCYTAQRRQLPAGGGLGVWGKQASGWASPFGEVYKESRLYRWELKTLYCLVLCPWCCCCCC